jgi:hypothetical protein
MKRVREWLLLGGGAVMAAALAGGGEPLRGAAVVALGVLGAAAVSRAGRRPRWPRLKKVLGRRALAPVDERLEPTLDAAEDALLAVAVEGTPFGGALGPVREGVLDLVRRGLGLSLVRSGHEATLARIFLESQASGLELAARTALAQVNAELEQIRGVLATLGPSVRHLRLITNTEQLDSGEAPAELQARVAFLRDALTEELAHGAA